MAKQLFEIKVLVEADSAAEVEQIAHDLERVICPHHPSADHRCPRRWFIVSSRLNRDEAAEWEDLLNS